ncbi:rRNA maturation RNase YbeY [Fodinibius salsisoli]|uniref:Endoribonuclease YbeY n=1 Tax=Fodinibius salsisoli TaxID=2820877 RepID=A0ABT3PQN6_9BACT|nr:rRNA maturation RNase YbeY [Fodinibius salsisoli]MCW9708182.1 rRNA maturation RNase YbeY [Fodinibius salsisoli]
MAVSKAEIHIFNQTSLSPPLSESQCQSILQAISSEENLTFNFVELVFVDEEEITRINREHLDHHYVTDIITFQYDESSTEEEEIEGTLFCCAPRIVEQAQEFGETAQREFQRVFIHGLLHLAGYQDKSATDKELMTEKENFYLDQAT